MSTLHERIQSLKTMLKEKSDNMAKLQADYEVIKACFNILDDLYNKLYFLLYCKNIILKIL